MSLRSAALVAAAFAALAGLVAAGTLAGIDQWSVEHLMPGAHFGPGSTALVDGLVPLHGAHWDGGLSTAAEIVLLPASFPIALVLVAWRSRILAAALLAAVAVEVLCKEAIVRPALHHGALHVRAFDSSFPSGHALRIVLLAAAFQPLLGRFALAWAAAAIVLLQLAGWHTPSDIAGGLLLGALALLLARAARARTAGALRARRLARAR